MLCLTSFAKTHDQCEYNEDRLQLLLISGARCVPLYAGHGFVKPGGVIQRLNIPDAMMADMFGETDNCGGLELKIRCLPVSFDTCHRKYCMFVLMSIASKLFGVARLTCSAVCS
jgi:hypothetical protein